MHLILCETIASELEKINLSEYKESMIGLIQKDIDELKELMT